MKGLETRQEKEHGYALERPNDSGRVRPRLGGTTVLPALAAAADLFLVSLEDLTVAERAAQAWCIRVGVPYPVREFDGYLDALPELLVELTVTVAGTAYTLEFNAFPGATIAVVGEQVSAKMKWSPEAIATIGTPLELAPPSGGALRWHVSRGWCETNAFRIFKLESAVTHETPQFATGFALFTSQETEISENIQLNFFSCVNSNIGIHHYSKEDLLQTFGAYTPIPPGCGAWKWPTEMMHSLRIAFRLGEQL